MNARQAKGRAQRLLAFIAWCLAEGRLAQVGAEGPMDIEWYDRPPLSRADQLRVKAELIRMGDALLERGREAEMRPARQQSPKTVTVPARGRR